MFLLFLLNYCYYDCPHCIIKAYLCYYVVAIPIQSLLVVSISYLLLILS